MGCRVQRSGTLEASFGLMEIGGGGRLRLMTTIHAPLKDVSSSDNAAPFEDVLRQAYEKAIAYLAGLDTAAVGATADLSTLRRQLGRPLAEQGIAAEQVRCV